MFCIGFAENKKVMSQLHPLLFTCSWALKRAHRPPLIIIRHLSLSQCTSIEYSFGKTIFSHPLKMSILDQSIRSMVDSCDEALEDNSTQDALHRICSRDTLDDSDDDILEVNPVCYSTDNLLDASSSMQMRPRKSAGALAADTDSNEEEEYGLPGYHEDRGSREKMMSYEINYHTDSEDDDDVYVPDWKIYEEFQAGVLEDDVLPINESLWMKSTDKLAMDAAAAEWDVQRRLGRKRHYRLGQMSSDLEDLVKQLDVIPAKIRRLDSEDSTRGGC